MKIAILASGSSGNSIFVGTDKTKLLIDAGISRAVIEGRLWAIGENISQVTHVLVTHEHCDHASHLHELVKRYRMTVVCSKAIEKVITERYLYWSVPDFLFFRPGDRISLGDLDVYPVGVEHNALEPVGFAVNDGKKLAVLATDLGIVPYCFQDLLAMANFIYLEANHDRQLLWYGSHTPALKQQISTNHLSNTQALNALESVDTDNVQVVLGHLSRDHNSTEHLRALTGERRIHIALPGDATPAYLV